MGHWGTAPQVFAEKLAKLDNFLKLPKKDMFYIFVYLARNTLKLE